MKKLLNYITKNVQQIVCILLLSIFFVFLIFPIFTQLDIVKNFPINPPMDALIAISAMILLLLILTSGRMKKLLHRCKNTYNLEYPPSLYPLNIFLFILFFILLIIRFQNEYISVLNISLKFIVFLSVNFILVITWFFSSFNWNPKKERKNMLNKDKFSLSEEAIEFPEQDLLDRKKFIEDLQREIEDMPFSDSFVFGLYGSWGAGKTSVINLLKNKFKESEDFLIVNYDPWNFKDEEAILAAFYDQIEKSFSQKFILPGFKKTFIKYQNLISMGLSQTGIKIDFLDAKESIEDIRQRIESYIAQTKKKIIIFIDDIDRLQPEEALFIFKLVRLHAKFQNTIFLLALDPIVVQNYFKKYLNVDSEFLEKIVQKPIPLPAIEQQNIDQFLDIHLEKLFDELAISKERREKFYKDFHLIYLMQISKFFKTLRRVKRYVNGLRSTLPLVKNEVNLYDFLILEIICNFFPKIYDDIWRNPWSYLPIKWDIKHYFSSPFASGVNEDKKNETIQDHIADIVADEKDDELIKGLLKALFFEVENSLEQSQSGQNKSTETYRVEKCITHPDCFKKYFMLKVPSSEISDEFIEATLALWHSIKNTEKENVISETIFDLQEKSMLSKFFNVLIVFVDKIPKEAIHEIIRVIYKNAGKFSKEGAQNIEGSEYLNSIKLLSSLVNNRIEKDKIHSILEETVINTPYLPFAVYIVGFCKEKGGSLYFNIYESANFDKLQNKVANRLKKHFVDEKRDIFEEISGWFFVLYHWGSNWGTFKGANYKIVNNYVLSLVKDDVKKFIPFLMSQKGISFEEKPVFNLKDISRIYSIEDLNKLAEKFKDNPALSIKEKDTIEIFLKTYKGYEKN
jgi:predicted KAP-like P-loop ATPase